MGRKKGGGGKLNRSEIIQARLDPKLHMAAEIMARSERRTLSSFIERSIEQAAKTNKIKRNLFYPWWSQMPSLNFHEKIYSKFDYVTVDEAVQDIAADHEAIRFFKFAINFPELLNKAEEDTFSKIIRTNYFWSHYPIIVENEWGQFIKHDWFCTSAIEGLVQENLVEYWDRLNQISWGDLNSLPMGKELYAPLRSDRKAIKKIIEKDDEVDPYEIEFAWETENQIELSAEEAFWKKNSKKLVTKKIEVKQTDGGPQIVTTLDLPENVDDQQIWKNFLQKKIGERNNDN